MGDGTEPFVQNDDQQLNNNNEEEQYMAELDKLQATSNAPKANDTLVGIGKIKDGSAFGTRFVVVQHMSSKGNPYLMLYQQVGFVSKSKEESKTDWRGEINVDTREQHMIERDKCVMFGYDKEGNFGKYTNWDIIKAPETNQQEEANMVSNEQKEVQTKNNGFDDDIPF